ncbi:MAG TPA: sensor histidine kinase [Ktedonobacteraceae bacterium]|nr:sensor histidine kinase [Ktedonobacteraceae bacterium]
MQRSNSNEARESSLAEGRSPYLLWMIWVVWTPLMIPAIVILFQAHLPLPHLIAALVGVVLFFVIYLWGAWRRAQYLVSVPSPAKNADASTWVVIVVLTMLSIILMLLGPGYGWQELFYYTSGYIGGALSLRRAIPVAVVITLLAMAVSWYTGSGLLDLVQTVVFVSAIIFIMKSMLWSITTSWELNAARKEISRLAVETERLRIARDLHDLLGHNLSLIALKSELAGRLVKAAPERAVAEIGDVENVARTTLQEVREAVASYRQPTLASELHAAREILTAAGVAYHYEGDENMIGTLPSAIEGVLAWAVREGVTNVIRHSRARQCTIRAARVKETAFIEIADDGVGSDSSSDRQGNGLRGLAERVAALGGQCETGSGSAGGFRIVVTMPLVQRNPHVEITSVSSASYMAQVTARTDGSAERSKQA